MRFTNDQIDASADQPPTREAAAMAMLRLAYVTLQQFAEQSEEITNRHAALLRRIAAGHAALNGSDVLRYGEDELAIYVAEPEQLKQRLAFLEQQRHHAVNEGRRAGRAYRAERMRYLVRLSDMLGGSRLILEAADNCPDFSAPGQAPDPRHSTRVLEAAYVSCLPESGTLLLRGDDGMERKAHAVVLCDNGSDRYAFTEGFKIVSVTNPALDYL